MEPQCKSLCKLSRLHDEDGHYMPIYGYQRTNGSEIPSLDIWAWFQQNICKYTLKRYVQRKLCPPQPSSKDGDLFKVTRLLAHLSRRLIGELIVYKGIRRPSVHPSVCQHFQTTSPLKPCGRFFSYFTYSIYR